LGISGISKSQISRLCQTLDPEVERFRIPPLVGPYPYVWLDATYLKVRQGGRVVSMAVVIALAVRAAGEREVRGLDVGSSDDGAIWLQFLRSLARLWRRPKSNPALESAQSGRVAGHEESRRCTLSERRMRESDEMGRPEGLNGR